MNNKGKPTALYNLESDIGEQKNVLGDHEEVSTRLLAAIEAFEADLAENSRPASFVDNPKTLAK